jgi:hypothetical protein
MAERLRRVPTMAFIGQAHHATLAPRTERSGAGFTAHGPRE